MGCPSWNRLVVWENPTSSHWSVLFSVLFQLLGLPPSRLIHFLTLWLSLLLFLTFSVYSRASHPSPVLQFQSVFMSLKHWNHFTNMETLCSFCRLHFENWVVPENVNIQSVPTPPSPGLLCKYTLKSTSTMPLNVDVPFLAPAPTLCSWIQYLQLPNKQFNKGRQFRDGCFKLHPVQNKTISFGYPNPSWCPVFGFAISKITCLCFRMLICTDWPEVLPQKSIL